MTEVRIQTYLGNARLLPFRVVQAGSQGWWDVSAATSIVLEVSKEGESPIAPLSCSSTATGADWTTGLIQAPISGGDVTARTGTYLFSLTMTLAGQPLTLGSGYIEVLPRQTMSYSLGNSGTFYAGVVKSSPNASGVMIPPGTLLSPGNNQTGVRPALAGGPGYFPAIGIAINNSSAGSTVLYIEDGWLQLSDWSAIYGSTALPTATAFYLGLSPGTSQLSVTVPTIAGGYGLSQIVGNSGTTTDTLYLVKGNALALQ